MIKTTSLFYVFVIISESKDAVSVKYLLLLKQTKQADREIANVSRRNKAKGV